MINLQNPSIPLPTTSIEIDSVVFDIQTKLDVNLLWLTNSYGRAYRHVKRKDGGLMYIPEVYIGVKKGVPSYTPMNPDNDKKGMCFFSVGKEQVEFNQNEYNYISYSIGIVFWVNLKSINSSLLNTEIFTQNLISEVRNVLTRKLTGTNYKLEIENVVREFSEVYREYSLHEDENYLVAPYQAFRFNCKVKFRENCINTNISSCSILQQNISKNEVLTCLLPTLNFQENDIFNSLTNQQKIDIQTQLGF